VSTLAFKSPVDMYLDILEYIRPKIPENLVIVPSKEALEVVKEVFDLSKTVVIIPEYLSFNSDLSVKLAEPHDEKVRLWLDIEGGEWVKSLVRELGYFDFNHLKTIYVHVWPISNPKVLGSLYIVLRNLRRLFPDKPIITFIDISLVREPIDVIGIYTWIYSAIKNKVFNAIIVFSYDFINKLFGHDISLRPIKGLEALKILFKIIKSKEGAFIKFIKECNNRGIYLYILVALLGVNTGILINGVRGLGKLIKLCIHHKFENVASSFNLVLTSRGISRDDIKGLVLSEGLGKDPIHVSIDTIKTLPPEVLFYICILGIEKNRINTRKVAESMAKVRELSKEGILDIGAETLNNIESMLKELGVMS